LGVCVPTVEVRLLGPFQVRIGKADVTDRLSASGCGLLAVLAGSAGPVRREDLRRSVALATSSLDPQLSKLTSSLALDRPVYRSRWPRAGYLALDREIVGVDVDPFLAACADAEAAASDDRPVDVVRAAVRADRLWRGPPFSDVVILPPDPEAPTLTAEMELAIRRGRRRTCALAAKAWLGRPDLALGAAPLTRWARELGDDQACWFAATCAALDAEGADAAQAVLDAWQDVDPAVPAPASPRALAVRLVDERRRGGPAAGWTAVTAEAADMVEDLVALAARAESRFEYLSAIDLATAAIDRSHTVGRAPIRLMRAEARRLCGDWDAAEGDYLAAADEAQAVGDPVAEAEVTLGMTRITWDLDRFGGRLRPRLERLLGELPDEAELLRAAVGACLAGGGYQTGEVDAGAGQAHARRALELIDRFDDPLVAAQVLSLARKALIDLDPPAVQLERARRIRELGAGSAEHGRLGDLAVIVDLLLLGRTGEARAATEAHRQLVDRTRATLHRYHQAAIDAMWALVDGRWDDAAADIAVADRLGRSFGRDTVSQVVGGQRLWLAHASGDRAAQEALLAGLVDATGGGKAPIWRCGAALLQVGLGLGDEAAASLRAVADESDDFAALPRGPHRLAVLALASEVAAGLRSGGGDVLVGGSGRSIGAALRSELETHPADAVLVGWPTIYLGSKRRYEGLAAEAAGDLSVAASRLEVAIDENRDAPALAARTRADLARVAAGDTGD
jgi:hypothetical protein